MQGGIWQIPVDILLYNYSVIPFTGEVTVTLEMLLIFWTGAEKVPPMGFGDKLKLAFYIMGGERRLPSASTCYKQLQLPRDIDTSDETAFFDIMITAILESQGFGKV